MNYTIRPTTVRDAEALLAIYAPYVTGTAITFEYTVPTAAEFAQRIERITSRYPYLTACDAATGKPLGYTYAHPYGEREAYAWSAEASIYLSPDARGHGLGRALYAALEDALKAMHIQNLYALVACSDRDDAYLTQNSAQFHEHLGFTRVGLMKNCGSKFGFWYHIATYEKMLGAHEKNPQPVAAWNGSARRAICGAATHLCAESL